MFKGDWPRAIQIRLQNARIARSKRACGESAGESGSRKKSQGHRRRCKTAALQSPKQKLRCRIPLLNLRMKIILAMAAVALFVVGAILATNYHLRRAQLLEEFQVFVRGVAGTAALALSGDEIETIRTQADAQSPAFAHAWKILDRTRRINHLAEQEIYILRPLDRSAVNTEFVVMLQPKTFIGSRYSVAPENQRELLSAWSSGGPASTGMYHDANGSWISGYAPVMRKDGTPAAIIEVDAEVSAFIAKQRRELFLSMLVGAGALCIAMVPGLLLARSITRGLHKLSDGMNRFRAGEHAVQVSVNTGDEIEELGAVFNEMILSLGEKLALLPYVSRFTAEAVRRSRDDPSWLTGSEQPVIVLFADLRGFTMFSEDREASVLVRELNRLLAVQADVVISAGGDVDKFIGDAVMAVFLDQEQNAAEKVLDCAAQLIARVHDETDSRGWSLGLGVGIHRGRAVVGSIGSETRRDFTAIGHTVNLASRLCDRARAWEVLVSEPFLQALPPARQSVFVRTEPLQFKNVQQFVATFVYTAGIDRATPRDVVSADLVP
jgi:class 3 adenylate cyclase